MRFILLRNSFAAKNISSDVRLFMRTFANCCTEQKKMEICPRHQNNSSAAITQSKDYVQYNCTVRVRACTLLALFDKQRIDTPHVFPVRQCCVVHMD